MAKATTTCFLTKLQPERKEEKKRNILLLFLLKYLRETPQ